MKGNVIFFFFCFLIFGSLQAQQKPVEWLSYVDSINNFSLKYPNNWIVGKANTSYNFSLLTKKEYDGDLFLDHLNLSVGDLPGDELLLEDLKILIEKKLRQQYKPFALIKAIRNSVGEQDVLQFEFRTQTNGSQGQIHLYVTQLTKIVGSKIVTLVLTCDFVDESQKRFLPTALKVFESIALLAKKTN